jgi:hypothetical protein
MAFTRQDLCIRVLGMLNRLDVDNPPSAGDVQLINGLIDASTDRLLSLNLFRRDPATGASVIDFGTASNPASGAIDNRVFTSLARVITRDVASDFGADAGVYETLAQQGEASLAQLRYKGPVGAASPPAPAGITVNRLQLIYETLQTLGVVGVNEPASADAIDKIDRLINPVLSQLQRRSVYSATDPGTYGAPGSSGAFPDSDVSALAQVLARPAALALGPKFIQGQVAEYIQLATDGENQLRQMRQEVEVNEPISFRDY